MNHSARAHVAGLSILGLSILGLAPALSVGSACADATTAFLGPLGLVKSSVARVLGVVQSWPMGSSERRTGIVRVRHELFDFNEIARRALGQHWKGLSPAEQDEFVQLFTDVLDREFIAGLDAYASDRVTFLGEAIDGDWAQVRSRIIPDKGAAIFIDYRLHEGNRRWAVYDVVWNHVSLVASYRNQFNSIIRASSAPQLLERMRADRLPRHEPSAQTALTPNRLAAGLLAAVLARHAPTSK
jgi:phospholipid transport system substrate-binding protein